ncbi:MAG: sulfite exporter TauE/SafE family protein [Deltaproteobacteria bacterium]|nr:sulfite exporter TauE/SafE family protein [Deltaproteobacteria bacterium]
MEPIQIAILAVAAFATSMLSAIVGMAGGIVLLSVMLLFLEPLVAIPLHGVVQLASNSSRTWVQRKHVRWPIIGAYCLLLVPMSFVGLRIAETLSPPVARLLIGGFVLIATWMPSLLLMGSAPFFLNLGLKRQGIIGTKAAAQALGHLVKIAVFAIAGFAFSEYALVLLLLSAMVVAGTWAGSQVLESVNELWFKRLFKTVLTLVALRLVILEGLNLLGI